VPLRIALVTTRKIVKGEQLFYNYYAKSTGHVRCRCGDAKCRQWVY
jgi:hypothetical protein